MKISEKIYRLRTENDLTQVQFGKIAGVSDKAVSTWELGIKEPRMRPLQKICAYFDIDINLFTDTETDIYKNGLVSKGETKLSKERQRALELLSKISDEELAKKMPALEAIFDR